MTTDQPAHGRVGWLVLAALLALLGAGFLVMWASAADDARTAADARTADLPSLAGSPAAPSPASVTPETTQPPARPVALEIPTIGVVTDLGELGLRRDGTVQVPADPSQAGWFRLGTHPGEPGSAVILGHVDSADGPAVFHRLGSLAIGARVVVPLEDGRTAYFRVASVRTYPNAEFPARRVYAAQRGRSLNLVTCGGAYDAAKGGYQSNVVVRATWIRTAAEA
ncbi:class F sortase [Nocardioides sp.]|uniref:class F sortase n=1 Tax=Nocardioides sp. TaxID=35761 RepID=UPI003561BB7A